MNVSRPSLIRVSIIRAASESAESVSESASRPISGHLPRPLSSLFPSQYPSRGGGLYAVAGGGRAAVAAEGRVEVVRRYPACRRGAARRRGHEEQLSEEMRTRAR